MNYTFDWSNKDFCDHVINGVSCDKTTDTSTWMLPAICETWANLWETCSPGLRDEFCEALFRVGFYSMVDDCNEAYMCWVTGDYDADILHRPLFNRLIQCFVGVNGKLIATCLQYAKRVYIPATEFNASEKAIKDWLALNNKCKDINLKSDYYVEDRWTCLPDLYGKTGHTGRYAKYHLAYHAVYPYGKIGHKHLIDSLRATCSDVMPESDVKMIWKRLESIFTPYDPKKARKSYKYWTSYKMYTPHFPSGSTADCKRSLTAQAEALYAAAGEEVLHGWQPMDTGYLLTGGDFQEDFIACLDRSKPFMRIIDVFKSGKAKRIIGPVSAVSNILCHELQVILYDYTPRYKYVHFDLSNQRVNRDLAQEGSIFGSFATEDLTAASDSIARKNLEVTIPQYLWNLLIRTVPTKGYVKGDDMPGYRHVQSTGISGAVTTYFIESLYFGNFLEYFCGLYYDFIATKTEREEIDAHLAKGGYLGAVKGDDIVIITPLAKAVAEALTSMGHTVNKTKSFDEGNFRESCGGNFISGFDVTPTYFPRRPVEAEATKDGKLLIKASDLLSHWEEGEVSVTTSIATIVAAHNALYQWPKAQIPLRRIIDQYSSIELTCSDDPEETGLKSIDETLHKKKFKVKPYSADAYCSYIDRKFTTEKVKTDLYIKDGGVFSNEKEVVKVTEAVKRTGTFIATTKECSRPIGLECIGSVGSKHWFVNYESYRPTTDDFRERVFKGPDIAVTTYGAGHDKIRDMVLYDLYLSQGPQYEDSLMELLGVSTPRKLK